MISTGKLIPPSLRDKAVADLEAGDVEVFLSCAPSQHALYLVMRNIDFLKERGLYERGLLYAITGAPLNHRHWPLDDLRTLFLAADRDRLRAAGDPLPGRGPFTVFRGVAGNGPARRVRGLSWTASQAWAQWFAERFPDLHLKDPAVFSYVVEEDDVLAYWNRRGEEEFVIIVPPSARLRRVGRVTQEEMERIYALIRDSHPDSRKN